MPAAPRLLSEIESPRPLRAPGGMISLTGWCLLDGQAEVPAVRLVTTDGILAMTGRQPRPDLPRLLPGQPAAACCGFIIAGRLPPGVHVGRFEAQLPDRSWQCFKRLTLAVEAPPFTATVESPAGRGPVHDRVYVEGWALHPTQTVRELSVRYGHQDIPCLLGGTRRDVPGLHPGAPQAAESGFRSKFILHAGHGKLRLKARLADGSTAVARTALRIEVATDENHGREIDFGAARTGLPGSPPRPAQRPPGQVARPLNVLFILYGSFASNSALHVAALAGELASTGHNCLVAVPRDVGTLARLGPVAFGGITHAAAAEKLVFTDGRGPDVIHAWTTRENVRGLTEKLRTRHGARVVVHLEDNEQEILALSLGRPAAELEKLPEAELARLVPADLSHPRHGREFLAQADAVTVITEKLAGLVPPGRACHTIRPAADARWFYPRPRPDEFRRALDLTPDETVLFYHGNVHASNAAEMRELYAAVLQLNRAGQPVTLIRTGLDAVDFLGPLAGEVAPHVLALGQILHHRHLPPLMALADIFVQPGRADAFNDYRFPSKLPEFFALGRPVVLPRTNLGTQVRHGTDAYVLDRADAAGITGAVTELRRDRELYAKLARGAAAFAEQHFSWRHSAEALAKFYLALIPS